MSSYSKQMFSLRHLDKWHYYMTDEKPIIELSEKTLDFLINYIINFEDTTHRLFLFSVYVKLRGSNKIINRDTGETRMIEDTILSDFLKYLHMYKSSLDKQIFSVLVSFYYILKAIITKNCLWILSMVSESKKPIDADIMRVHINQETGKISYTKPECLK